MRRLIAARHAKSSWNHPELTDHDRPLNARGRRAAPLVGAALRGAGYIPDLLLCSTSVRTRETWDLMRPALGGAAGPTGSARTPEVRFARELYLAAPQTVLKIVRQVPPAIKTLMLLGHNPAMYSLATHGASAGDPEEISLLRRNLPTGAAAVLEFPTDRWNEVKTDEGRLLALILPRRLDES